jgi:hypothetical protein
LPDVTERRVMKANKARKRLAKIEALISEVTERYSSSALHIREALRDAKAAFARVKEAVSSQASSGKAKTPAPKVRSEPAKPKRRLSAAGRKAIREALKRRWAQKKAATAQSDRAAHKTTPARKKASVDAAAAKTAKNRPPIKKTAKKAKKTNAAAALKAPAPVWRAPSTVHTPSLPVEPATEPSAQDPVPGPPRD